MRQTKDIVTPILMEYEKFMLQGKWLDKSLLHFNTFEIGVLLNFRYHYGQS